MDRPLPVSSTVILSQDCSAKKDFCLKRLHDGATHGATRFQKPTVTVTLPPLEVALIAFDTKFRMIFAILGFSPSMQ